MTTVGHPAYSALFEKLLADPEFSLLVEEVRGSKGVVVGSGLVGSSKALALAALQRAVDRPVVYVTLSASALENARRDIEYFYCALHGVTSCADAVLTLPDSEDDPFAGISPHAEVL